MKIAKVNYQDKAGKTCKSQKYYIDFRDHLNRRHKLAGFKHMQPTADLGRQIEGLISAKLGNSSLTPSQQAWIEGLPTGLLKNLISWGLIDGQRAESGKALTLHLQDWKLSIAHDSTEQHANQQHDRVKRIFNKANFVYFSDISASKLQLQISKLKKTVKIKNSKGRLVDKELSAASQRTKNYYLKACKQFLKWAVQDNRISKNPLEHLKTAKAESQRRAALEPDELRQLLTHTKAAGLSFGLAGYQRAMLYQFAAETGFRAAEIRALKVSDFDFENNIVMLSGQHTKNNKTASLPIRPATADRLKELFSDKLPAATAFKLPYNTNMARMFRADIETSGIEIDSQRGTLDFHSLRHTFGTLLAASGVHPKTAQQLMRHGDINMTLSRYTHTLRGQESQAIDGLPDLEKMPENMQQKMTGTDGKNVDEISDFYFDRSFTKNTAKQCNSLHNIAKQCPDVGKTENSDIELKTGILSENQGVLVMGRGGLEPPTHGFSVRCSTN